ncbi:MAG TPA: hypothetical protein VFF47_04585 [Nitrospirota bacterium]|nr:hypothetical protein [Nitrospirota bacterium]
MKRKLISLTIIFILSWNFAAHAGESIDATIDKDLKAIWISMINRLSAGDIEGAIAYITYSSRWKYKKEFTSVKDKLPEISVKMRNIEPVYIKDDEAKYRSRIGTSNDEYTNYIWFRKDIFGIWKIEKF